MIQKTWQWLRYVLGAAAAAAAALFLSRRRDAAPPPATEAVGEAFEAHRRQAQTIKEEHDAEKLAREARAKEQANVLRQDPAELDRLLVEAGSDSTDPDRVH